MPQLQSTVLTDRESTPVNHTFVPRDIRDGVGTCVESTGVPIGESVLSVSTRRTNTGVFKPRVKLVIPVVQNETVNGVTRPVIVRTGYADVTFTFDEESTETERNNLVGMFADAFDPANILINDAVVKLQGVY